MFQPDLLKDKVVVITGGGTGLGRSMGERFLQLGAKLAITSRRDEVLRQAAAEMTAAHGGEVFAVTCDVRDPEAVDHMIAAVWEHYDGIDVLVNNAAGNFASPTERLSHRAVDSVLGIVLHGTFYCTLALGKRWIAAGRGGRVLNIVTTYAETGSAYVVPSAAAKAGVLATDAFAGRRVGEIRHHAERHRTRPLPHAGRVGAADAEPRAGRDRAQPHPAETRRPARGAGQPGRVPHRGRLGVHQRRVRRDRRRRMAQGRGSVHLAGGAQRRRVGRLRRARARGAR